LQGDDDGIIVGGLYLGNGRKRIGYALLRPELALDVELHRSRIERLAIGEFDAGTQFESISELVGGYLIALRQAGHDVERAVLIFEKRLINTAPDEGRLTIEGDAGIERHRLRARCDDQRVLAGGMNGRGVDQCRSDHREHDRCGWAKHPASPGAHTKAIDDGHHAAPPLNPSGASGLCSLGSGSWCKSTAIGFAASRSPALPSHELRHAILVIFSPSTRTPLSNHCGYPSDSGQHCGPGGLGIRLATTPERWASGRVRCRVFSPL